jgi:hypothetical protein
LCASTVNENTRNVLIRRISAITGCDKPSLCQARKILEIPFSELAMLLHSTSGLTLTSSSLTAICRGKNILRFL